jgi:hypothetical protein
MREPGDRGSGPSEIESRRDAGKQRPLAQLSSLYWAKSLVRDLAPYRM